MTRVRLSAAAAFAVFLLVLAMVPAGAATPAVQSSWGARLTCTADASGFCVVPHPAGVVPDAVTVTPELPAIVSVDQLSAATFRARFCRLVSSTGACTALTGSRAFYAHIDFTPGGPSPSASVSPSASPVPSGSPTVSPMPPSSPSPTPGPVAAWPDASNTGVPPGTVLTAVNGDVTVTVANTTIDAKDIHGCVEVRAPGVTLKRSKVHCMSVAVASFDGVYTGTPLTIEDSEIDCLNSGGTAVGDTNVTARRLNVHGCENGFDIDANVTVQDSYIHDLYNSAQAHTDGIQLASGHFVNGALVPAAANVTVVHNRIYANSGTSAMISNSGGDTNILIQNNLMAGGAYTLYCEQGTTGTNFRVLDNHISRLFYPTGGAYGPWTDCTDETVSGNVWDETGAPLT
jgi:hypothetical protein